MARGNQTNHVVPSSQAPGAQQNVTENTIIIAPENPLSPYHISSGDSPAMAIVSAQDIFKGDNFVAWSKSVFQGLNVKNKVGFIDGSIHVPSPTDFLMYTAWSRANSLVLCWIKNSIQSDIKQSILYINDARELWVEMHTRYARSSGPRVFHLVQSLSSIKKGGQTITEYYNAFKAIWDEYMSLRPVYRCDCGVMVNCKCNLLSLMAQTQEGDAIIQFLVGLDDVYAHLRSQLLLATPLPTLSKAYCLLLQEEAQRSLNQPINSMDSMAMMTRPVNAFAQQRSNVVYKPQGAYNKDKKKVQCTYCKLYNHTEDKCFQKHGYPPGWKTSTTSRYNTRSTSANVVISEGNVSSEHFMFIIHYLILIY